MVKLSSTADSGITLRLESVSVLASNVCTVASSVSTTLCVRSMRTSPPVVTSHAHHSCSPLATLDAATITTSTRPCTSFHPCGFTSCAAMPARYHATLGVSFLVGILGSSRPFYLTTLTTTAMTPTPPPPPAPRKRALPSIEVQARTCQPRLGGCLRTANGWRRSGKFTGFWGSTPPTVLGHHPTLRMRWLCQNHSSAARRGARSASRSRVEKVQV